jgi:hypothetical protein
VLEINKAALDAVGIKLADVEGKLFWKTFWWRVSEEIRGILLPKSTGRILGVDACRTRLPSSLSAKAGVKSGVFLEPGGPRTLKISLIY